MQPSLVEVYLQESDELLASIEANALSLRSGADDRDAIDASFRALHTIKGSGGMFGFDEVVSFTHEVETLLDQVRDGRVAVSDALSDVVLAAADHIRVLIQAAQGGALPEAAAQAVLLERVRKLSATGDASPGTGRPEAREPARKDGTALWRIRFRPEPQLLAQGGNPLLLFRDLKEFGECVIEGHTDQLPGLEELDPELCLLRWSILLRTGASVAEIRDVFLFVEEGSELVIEPAEAAQAPVVDTAAGEAAGEVAARQVGGGAREATVRVPATRLDRLVNLVGELVMNQSRLATAAARYRSPELAAPVEEIERLVAELRDDVLQIRMMPIGTIFGRFRRLVHDLSRQLAKEVELVTEGEETELDKSILDQLGEPLVHLLRNSLDHGIEAAGDREARGKARRGTIRLAASHRGSDVVVTIEDDGAGLNREAIRAKAIAKGLIGSDAGLSDKEVLQLILLPGFSTAAQVTDVSGRGVGMDVVKRQIDALRGMLTLASEPGRGTTVSITLPLTLAIIDGLLVEAGESQYIIPMASVTENVELTMPDRRRHNGRNLIAVRGELLPYVDLRKSFAIPGEAPPISKIVLVRHEDQRVGLVVDRVMGTHQTVIQALGRFFRKIDVISGCTVMGDGRVALVLDIVGVVRGVDGPVREIQRDAAA